jgi:hypothetical protein
MIRGYLVDPIRHSQIFMSSILYCEISNDAIQIAKSDRLNFVTDAFIRLGLNNVSSG